MPSISRGGILLAKDALLVHSSEIQRIADRIFSYQDAWDSLEVVVQRVLYAQVFLDAIQQVLQAYGNAQAVDCGVFHKNVVEALGQPNWPLKKEALAVVVADIFQQAFSDPPDAATEEDFISNFNQVMENTERTATLAAFFEVQGMREFFIVQVELCVREEEFSDDED